MTTLILIFAILLTPFSYGEAKGEKYVPVLMYHHFDENFSYEKSSSIISPENFKKHMKYLNDIGYNTITFSDLGKAKKGELVLPSNPIIISIDDGYLSTYTYAYPILKELNMKANVNIVVSQVGKTPGDYPHFDWSQGRQMLESGLIEIGSHTFNLHSSKMFQAPGEKEQDYYNRLLADFALSKFQIGENLCIDTPILCLPYGYENELILQAAKDSGFNTILTLQKGINYFGKELDDIKRININGNDTPQDILEKISNYSDDITSIPLIDVDSNSTDFTDMLYLYKKGYVKGFPNGSFKLDNYIYKKDIFNILKKSCNLNLQHSVVLSLDSSKDNMIGQHLSEIMGIIYPELDFSKYEEILSKNDFVTRREFFKLLKYILEQEESMNFLNF